MGRMEKTSQANESQLHCSWHATADDLNRGGIRSALRAMLTEAMAVVHTASESDLATVSHLPVEQTTRDYASLRDAKADMYSTALSESAALRQASGLFSRYTVASTNSRYAIPVLESPMLPIGAYGEVATQRLMTAAVRLIALCEMKGDEIDAVGRRDASSHELVRRHTFKGQDHDGSILLNVEEGIVSTAQVLALLAAEKPSEGMPWKELIQNLVYKDAITEYTQRVGGSLVSRQVVYGRYAKHPIEASMAANGALTDTLKATLNLNKRHTLRYIAQVVHDLPHLRERMQSTPEVDDPKRAKEKEAVHDYLQAHFAASSSLCPAADAFGIVYYTGHLLLNFID